MRWKKKKQKDEGVRVMWTTKANEYNSGERHLLH